MTTVLPLTLTRISHHDVPLLGTSSVDAVGCAQHCFCQAVAHGGPSSPHGEKCALTANRFRKIRIVPVQIRFVIHPRPESRLLERSVTLDQS
jgi:hypothetical protein